MTILKSQDPKASTKFSVRRATLQTSHETHMILATIEQLLIGGSKPILHLNTCRLLSCLDIIEQWSMNLGEIQIGKFNHQVDDGWGLTADRKKLFTSDASSTLLHCSPNNERMFRAF